MSSASRGSSSSRVVSGAGLIAAAALTLFSLSPHRSDAFSPPPTTTTTFCSVATTTVKNDGIVVVSERGRGGGGGGRPATANTVAAAARERSTLLAASPVSSDAGAAAFRGRTVLVTGASGGLGRALASRLATDLGVATLLLSGRDEGRLEEAARECRRRVAAAGGDGVVAVRTFACDLADPAQVRRLGDEAAASGVDVLINNGGVSSRSSFLDTDSEVDERLLRVNFLAGAELAKRVVPGMIDDKENGDGVVGNERRLKGLLIWISSVQGLVGIPNRTSYAASKFAVQGYCEALRAELASDGVSVHVVSPGYVRTGLSEAAVTGDGSVHGVTDATTANGADPDDVAAEILNRVAKGEPEILVAASLSARAAIWLRFLSPSVLRKILVKRFDKTRSEQESK